MEINDQLMKESMEARSLATKKTTVEEGLRLIVRLKRQSRIKEFRGKLKWEGDLDQMRSGL